jgi:hypothetical protein
MTLEKQNSSLVNNLEMIVVESSILFSPDERKNFHLSGFTSIFPSFHVAIEKISRKIGWTPSFVNVICCASLKIMSPLRILKELQSDIHEMIINVKYINEKEFVVYYEFINSSSKLRISFLDCDSKNLDVCSSFSFFNINWIIAPIPWLMSAKKVTSSMFDLNFCTQEWVRLKVFSIIINRVKLIQQ